MKIYICCVPAQILHLGKILFLRSRLSAIQVAVFLNQPFLQNKSTKQPHFLHVDTSSYKLKVNQKIFVWAWSKMGVTNLHSGL